MGVMGSTVKIVNPNWPTFEGDFNPKNCRYEGFGVQPTTGIRFAGTWSFDLNLGLVSDWKDAVVNSNTGGLH